MSKRSTILFAVLVIILNVVNIVLYISLFTIDQEQTFSGDVPHANRK